MAKSAGVRLGTLTGTQVADDIQETRGTTAPSLGPGEADPGRTRQPRQARARRQDSGWQDQHRQAVAWEGV